MSAVQPEPPVEPGRTAGVQGVLDAIEDAVVGARAMPMSSSVIVNRTELLALLAQVREALPGQLSAADDVLASVDERRQQAAATAEVLLADARAQADRLVGHEQVVAEARERADRIVADAHAEARRLLHDADDYCDRRLAEFEIDLGKVLAQVQAGRARLADRLRDQ